MIVPTEPGVGERTQVTNSAWRDRGETYSPDGRNANNLTSQRTADLGGGATFYDCRVQVERVGGAAA